MAVEDEEELLLSKATGESLSPLLCLDLVKQAYDLCCPGQLK